MPVVLTSVLVRKKRIHLPHGALVVDLGCELVDACTFDRIVTDCCPEGIFRFLRAAFSEGTGIFAALDGTSRAMIGQDIVDAGGNPTGSGEWTTHLEDYLEPNVQVTILCNPGGGSGIPGNWQLLIVVGLTCFIPGDVAYTLVSEQCEDEFQLVWDVTVATGNPLCDGSFRVTVTEGLAAVSTGPAAGDGPADRVMTHLIVRRARVYFPNGTEAPQEMLPSEIGCCDT